MSESENQTTFSEVPSEISATPGMLERAGTQGVTSEIGATPGMLERAGTQGVTSEISATPGMLERAGTQGVTSEISATPEMLERGQTESRLQSSKTPGQENIAVTPVELEVADTGKTSNVGAETLFDKIKPKFSQGWTLQAVSHAHVVIHQTDDDNSDWLFVNYSSKDDGKDEFILKHGTEFHNIVDTIDAIIERATCWFESTVEEPESD